MTDLTIDRVEVYTQVALQEQGVNCPHALLARVHRADGALIQIAFETIERVAAYVAEMRPNAAAVYCGDGEDLDQLVHALNGNGPNATVH